MASKGEEPRDAADLKAAKVDEVGFQEAMQQENQASNKPPGGVEDEHKEGHAAKKLEQVEPAGADEVE